MKRGEMDAFEVLKIVGFLLAVGFFWFLFTAERDANRVLKGEIDLLKTEQKKLDDQMTGVDLKVDRRLSDWTEKMMLHKNEVDLVKRESANLVTQCQALESKMNKKPRPINVKIQNVPVELLSRPPVQSKVKEAARNLKRSGLSK